jgi:sugar phosphate isomerase/epimerase
MTNTLSRRSFLAVAGAAPLAASTALHAFQTKKIPVGIELYSVRDALVKDIPGTVTAVAKMGYQVVEFYSPYMNWTMEQAKEVRKLLDDLGIKCPSTHNGVNSISDKQIQQAIDLNQTIGSKAIIIASPPKVQGVDGWKSFAAALTKAADRLRAAGMVTGFHNHQSEWRPVAEGSPERCMDVLAANTPKEVVLQLDCGTCVEAGADPVAWIKAHPGRIKSLHLKDWGKGEGRGYNVAFGEGDVQWKPLLDAAETVGGAEYHLIEQEHPGAIGEIAMAQKCLDNYKKLRG